MLHALIVDDDPQLCTITRQMLTMLNCDSRVASNGIQAEAVALQEQPALILLDIMMPVQDGYETCANLRAKGYTGNIILISALPEGSGIAKAAECGANAYIQKPITLKVLRLHLNHLQSRELT